MSQETSRFYLIRHGITRWNRALRMQGHTDIPLDPEGLEQAQRIGERLQKVALPPAAIWASDLIRARQTAEAIASRLRLEIKTTPLLRETMLGEWEGLTREDIEARGEAELLQRYREAPHINRPPGGESLEAAWERMTEAWRMIHEAEGAGPIAIVGHGGTLRVLLCAALDAGIPSMRRIWLDNASLSIIEQYGSKETLFRRILLLNDTSHLEKSMP